MIPRRAQAALEYLFTYGWAFFAIIVTVGVLAYFGVFDFVSLKGNECQFPPGAVCEDWTITNRIGMCGDLDKDGEIDADDRDMVNAHALGTYVLTREQQLLADVNNDLSVDGADANLIELNYGFDDSVFANYPCSPPTVRAQLRNAFGADLNISFMNGSGLIGKIVECGPDAGPSFSDEPFLWDQDEIFNMTCLMDEATYASGQGYDLTFAMNFTQQDHTYEHVLRGWIQYKAR